MKPVFGGFDTRLKCIKFRLALVYQLARENGGKIEKKLFCSKKDSDGGGVMYRFYFRSFYD